MTESALSLSGSVDQNIPVGPGKLQFQGAIKAGFNSGGVASSAGLISYGAVDFSADFAASASVDIRVNIGYRKVSQSYSANFASLHVGLTGNEPGRGTHWLRRPGIGI